MQERLSKLLAFEGLASRRAADDLVREGRVTVNGEVVTEPGHRVTSGQDYVKVDGKPLHFETSPTYVLLNKPRGVISTRSDVAGRPTVVSMLRGFHGRLQPVGRLDPDDEGALLVTSDSTLAHALNHHTEGIDQSLLVKVRGMPDESTLEKMRSGVPLEGGKSAPIHISRVTKTAQNAWLRITFRDPRPRMLKWLMMKLRHPLVKVRRVGYGPLSVGGLAPGTYRLLTGQEVEQLKRSFGLLKPLATSDEAAKSVLEKSADPLTAFRRDSAPPKPKVPRRPTKSATLRDPTTQIKGIRRIKKSDVMDARSMNEQKGRAASEKEPSPPRRMRKP